MRISKCVACSVNEQFGHYATNCALDRFIGLCDVHDTSNRYKLLTKLSKIKDSIQLKLFISQGNIFEVPSNEGLKRKSEFARRNYKHRLKYTRTTEVTQWIHASVKLMLE